LSILVTGTDTLLGYHVAQALSDSGLVVQLLAPAGSRQEDFGLETASFHTTTGGILDLESCISALDGATAVFHCESGRLSPAARDEAAGPTFVEGTRNLLLAMSRTGVEDLVLAGSAFVFGPGTIEEPGDEESAWDNPLRVPCLDAVRAASDLAQRYAGDGKVRCVTVSPTLLFGEGDRPGTASWWLLEHAAELMDRAPTGGINIARAADAGAAAVRALGRGKSGQSFILGGTNVPYEILLREISLAVGTPAGSAPAGQRGLLGRLKGSRRSLDPIIGGLGGAGLYYSSSRAVEQLDLEAAPVSVTVAEAASWFLSSR
jgi:dihydroflavonol-4-reductase